MLDNWGNTHTTRICNNYCFSKARVVRRTHLNLAVKRTLPLLLFYKQQPKYFDPHNDQAAGRATELGCFNYQKLWETLHFSKYFTPCVGPTQPLSNGYVRLFMSQRQSGLCMNLTAHLHQVPQIKNLWIRASTPSYYFKALCFIKQKTPFLFTGYQ